MAQTRRDFLGSFIALAAAGCSGEAANSMLRSTPPRPNGVGSPGSAGAPGSTNVGTAGSAAMPGGLSESAAQAMPTNAAGAPGMLADASPVPAQASPPALCVLRGRVTTMPPQAAKHAIVYLVNAPLEKVVDARIDDVKLDFHPHVSVMTAGGMMTYVNNHPFPDSCFSTNNERFDFGYVEAHGVRKRKFSAAGHYTLLCHVHPNEVGFLIVTPSSYFARVDAHGEFVMSDVPAGSYDVVAWAPRVQSERRTVVVAAGDVAADFDLKR